MGSLEFEFFDLAEIFLDLDEVDLEVELSISDIGKEVRVDPAKKRSDDSGRFQLLERIYAKLLSDDLTLSV